MQKEKKKVLLTCIGVSLVSLIFIFCVFLKLSGLDKPYKIKKYIKSNREELQKLINNEIEFGEMKNKSLIKNIWEDCNSDSCFIRFDIGGSGFASNTCDYGFYYTKKDIMHKYEYYDRIIEGENLNYYIVKEKSDDSDNIMYLTRIMAHWYYFKSCF